MTYHFVKVLLDHYSTLNNEIAKQYYNYYLSLYRAYNN